MGQRTHRSDPGLTVTVRIGIAGWSIPLSLAAEFPGEGQHLQRYARKLNCAEINSSFYRSHRAQTYERWASMTSPDFRFSVKLPRTITHEARLRHFGEPLEQFLAEVAELGEKLGVILVQLPPSLGLEADTARKLFDTLVGHGSAAVVIEPRHLSWFTPAAERLLVTCHVSRAAADPACCAAAAMPGGWLGHTQRGEPSGVAYYRWHGSPRMYWSAYSTAWLEARKSEIEEIRSAGVEAWCIFDNTAGGAALPNAIEAVETYNGSG